jgi:plasmid stabilization system protein ParE
MAVIIKWSDEAQSTFDNNIDYLMREWSEREIINFIKQTDIKLLNIKSNPKIYRSSEKYPEVRKTSINKHVTLFYRYFPIKKEVILLTFWYNKQDPGKLKY